MLELLIGFGVSAWMGAGGTYLVLLMFAFAFPRLFRVLYWLFMFPVMALGSAAMSWLFGGFFFGWGKEMFEIWLVCGALFSLTFCKLTDPA